MAILIIRPRVCREVKEILPKKSIIAKIFGEENEEEVMYWVMMICIMACGILLLMMWI